MLKDPFPIQDVQCQSGQPCRRAPDLCVRSGSLATSTSNISIQPSKSQRNIVAQLVRGLHS